ncbi:hypothetical protein RHMOL_Rhmol06G0018600 [Rhododendron molle]|uniref:Uncharacterized protein n=1 Tax=Rhododendron molle TaxID=49168 RepID=A0ACC0N9Q3_RHOML|nr:hypothetical protein RHMOL_Rhmol06G0018600 [Rhododendron molle]
MDWKNMGSSDVQNEPSTGPVIKKWLPRNIRQIPECYFLPRRSIPSAIAFYGAWIAGGIGAGMPLEVWIKKKVKGGQPTVMAMCWSLLGIKRVTELMLIFQKENGHKLLVSMISSSSTRDIVTLAYSSSKQHQGAEQS